MTENEQAAAILAALNTALSPVVAYEYGKVPGANGVSGTEPARYAVVSLSRRYMDGRLLSGEARVRGYRLNTRYIAKSAADVRNMRRIVTETLEDRFLADGTVGPFVFESADPPRPDESFQVAEDTWTF